MVSVGPDKLSAMAGTATTESMRRGTVAMLAGQVARIGVQGGYFILLARTLGAHEFGAVAAVLALVALLIPYSNLGSALLLVKNVSRDTATASIQWANTVALTLLSGGALAVLLALAAPLVTAQGISPWAVAAVGISDLVCARLIESSAGLYQVTGRVGHSASLQAILQGARLVALTLLVMTPWAVHLENWAVSYLAASVAVAVGFGIASSRHAGVTRPQLSHYWAEWRTGALFSVGMSSQTVYNDVDKAFLAKLSTLEATGVYSAAYRIIDMSYVPMRALISASYPAMMRAGRDGLRAVLRVVRRDIALPAAAYCVVGTTAMIAGADVVPLVLGDSFQSSVPALRLLAVLLIFKGLHYVAADTLTSANEQGARTIIQVGIAALNVALCLVLIPRYAWHGAVAASLVCDGLLAVALWATIWRRVRTLRREELGP